MVQPAQALKAALIGVEPSDPRTYVIVIAVLTVVGVLAGWIPARRARESIRSWRFATNSAFLPSHP
jgi:hypothetical protein